MRNRRDRVIGRSGDRPSRKSMVKLYAAIGIISGLSEDKALEIIPAYKDMMEAQGFERPVINCKQDLLDYFRSMVDGKVPLIAKSQKPGAAS